jgi:hypothetical protein
MANPPEPSSNHENNAQQQQALPIIFDEVPITYANFCRGTLSPEEVILDLGFNPNAFGVKVLAEDVEIKNRIILSPSAAKRLLLLLNNMVQNHEQNFGEIEVDFRRRLKNQPQNSADNSRI